MAYKATNHFDNDRQTSKEIRC